jgi:hypothetical protein
MSNGHSYSNLTTFQTCPRKYKLQVIDKEPTGEPQSGNMHFGSALHSGLSAMLAGEDARMCFDLFWESEQGKPYTYYGQTWESLRDFGHTFLDRFERLHLKKFKPHSIERRLYAGFDGVEFEGTPDFVGEFEGIPTVLDFKTSMKAYVKPRILANPQLYLYSWLAEHDLKYKVEQLAYMVFAMERDKPRIQTLRVGLHSPIQAKHVLNLWETARQAEKAGAEPIRNCNSCLMGNYTCDYFKKCWGDPETVET